MKALYAGSFDPLTYGHLNVIQRASRLYDTLYLAIAANSSKQNLFTLAERVALARESVLGIDNVEVVALKDGLTVSMARELGCQVLVRGLRNTLDFEYEANMAWLNHHQAPEIETVILTTAERYHHLSSSLVKEIARYGGEIKDFVPEHIAYAMREKYTKN